VLFILSMVFYLVLFSLLFCINPKIWNWVKIKLVKIEIDFYNAIPCGFDLALVHTLYCKRFVRLQVF
jgi:hypothetical protein